MYTRMLIALDGSKVAEQVLPYARVLAGALKIPVELLNVIDLAGLAATMDAGYTRLLDSIGETQLREARKYLEGIAWSLRGITASCFVEKGSPEEVILEKAALDKGTLIAMATHGRSGINRWLMGSIAEKVLRAATNPLLLVRAREDEQIEGEPTLKSIVVPLDGSGLAETVLPGVIGLAKKLNLEIVLTRVYAPPMATYAGADEYYAPNYEELKALVKEEAGAYLAAKVTELKGKGMPNVSSVLLEGSAPEEIIEWARQTPGNLIAMCTHGRSGVKRWVLGSVTEKVVRHSRDPVLVISVKAESRSESGDGLRNALKYTID